MAVATEARGGAESAGSVFALLQDGGRRGRCPWLRPAASAPPLPRSSPPPSRCGQSGRWGLREESGCPALDMAAAAAIAASKGNGGGGGRAGAGEASSSRRKKGPGPLATAYLVIYNVVMTAG